MILVCCFITSGLKAQPIIDTVCLGSGPTHLAVPFQAGVQYFWQVNGGTIISKPDSNDITVNWNGLPGSYLVSVSSVPIGGCSDTSKAFVYLVSPDIASITGPSVVCEGSPIVLLSTLRSGVTWQGGKKEDEITFVAERDTTIFLITDNAPCASDTVYHSITVTPAPQTSMSKLEDTLQIGTVVDLYYTGVSGVSVDWYFDDHYQGTGTYQRYNFDEEGNHIVTQVVSENGCTDTLYRNVYVKKIFKLFIPNAFTPDGDGVNDVFYFDGMGIARFEAAIYNRWGEKVYSWNERSGVEGWDGTYHGKPVPMGVYSYKITVVDRGGKRVEERGTFKVLR